MSKSKNNCYNCKFSYITTGVEGNHIYICDRKSQIKDLSKLTEEWTDFNSVEKPELKCKYFIKSDIVGYDKGSYGDSSFHNHFLGRE